MSNVINDLKKYIDGMSKRKKQLCVLCFIFLIVFIIFVICFSNKDFFVNVLENEHGERFKMEYEQLNDKMSDDEIRYPQVNIPVNNKIKYISQDEIIGIFEDKGDAVIYLGYPKCLYCRTVAQVLIDTALNTEIDVIYYLEVRDNYDGYDKLFQYFDDKFFVVENDKKKIELPLVLFVVNGEIASYNIGTVFSHENPYNKLDEYQLKGLVGIYEYGISDVLTSIKLKNNKYVVDKDNVETNIDS